MFSWIVGNIFVLAASRKELKHQIIMANELWGTFSIYDHRNEIFKQSLILFDRIVIPIPNEPLGNQTHKELDQLYADAKFLSDNDAAIIYEWNTNEFQDWQAGFLREALSENFSLENRDNLYDTRLMLQGETENLKPKGINKITALPVYGAKEEFKKAYANLGHVVDEGVMIELCQLLSTPDKNAPLEDIIRLRNKKSFISAKKSFKEWQFKKIPEILGEKKISNINLAKEEFQDMLERYEDEITKGNFQKRKIVITSLLALGSIFSAAIGQTQTAIALISSTAPYLFSMKEISTQSWKDLRDKPFEAAGIIYEANKKL